MKEGKFCLGIDIGTSSVKICLIDTSGLVLKSLSIEYNQEKLKVECDDKLHSEQNVDHIFETIEMCTSSINENLLRNISHIAVCGQMHGVCFWNSKDNRILNGRFKSGLNCSNLINWMDQRCSTEFLNSLPEPNSNLRVRSGYGVPTIFWLLKNNRVVLDQYDSAGTIMDFFVATLVGGKTKMSSQNAASFGYFDPVTNSFNLDILEKNAFPTKLLPEISNEFIFSNLCSQWLGIQSTATIGPAYGDFQCSVYSAFNFKNTSQNLHSDNEKKCAFINLSTSAQIGYIVSKNHFESMEKSDKIECVPYFNNDFMAVGASLFGGNILASYVESIKNILRTFGVNLNKEEIWDKIITEASKIPPNSQEDSFNLEFFGERHHESSNCSLTLSQINLGNISNLSQISLSFFRGILLNLEKFLNISQMRENGIEKIVASGSAITKNPVLEREMRKIFDIEIEIVETDAAYGAALYYVQNFKN